MVKTPHTGHRRNHTRENTIMAGQPITRAFLEKIEREDVSSILNRIADGESIAAIAGTIGVSRAFLSAYMNSTPTGREAVGIAREIAQRERKRGRVSRMCGPAAERKREQVQGWVLARLSMTNGNGGTASAERASTQHLAALKQLRLEADARMESTRREI
jgi:hypothetical protein